MTPMKMESLPTPDTCAVQASGQVGQVETQVHTQARSMWPDLTCKGRVFVLRKHWRHALGCGTHWVAQKLKAGFSSQGTNHTLQEPSNQASNWLDRSTDWQAR